MRHSQSNGTAPSRVQKGQKAGRVAQYTEILKVAAVHKTNLAKSHYFNGDFISIIYKPYMRTWDKGAKKPAKVLHDTARDFMNPV
jgi:hypothetical protein